MSALNKIEVRDVARDCSEVAYFWRGACLDLFSQFELVVADCLEALQEAGVELPRECFHPFPATRLSGLRDLLEAHSFEGHSREAIARIGESQEQQKVRPWLAHGRFSFSSDAVTIALTSYPHGQRVDAEPQTFNAFEMLRFTKALHATLASLRQQLGQIVASARRGSVA
jgi:hypothetical protein